MQSNAPRTLTVLHLDDDALYLEQLAAILARASLDVALRVVSVDDIDEYYAALEREAPDIVVLDVNVRGSLSGKDVARETRSRAPQCLVFMCSDMRGIGLVSACLSAGADDFIFKGGDERELALRLYGTWKLRSETRAASTPGTGAAGKTMREVRARLDRIARSAITAVHVRGESGTGKELVSELLQGVLPAGMPFVRVNCGAIAPTLLESELFGHVRGAFTGATSDKVGLVEKSDGGWIFFDEVATLSPAAQVALLRVLESHTVRKVGGNVEKKVKIRVLSATNEPVEKLIEAGRFRGDLWQRLCESSIDLPPLRERMDEFDELVRHFCREMSGGPYEIAGGALDLLSAYEWRDGNVRELRNCLRAMTEMAIGRLLTPVALPKWFWERVEQRPDDAAAPATPPSASAGAASDADIRLAWPKDGLPLFEPLVGKLLLELLRREAFANGKVSIRHLARRTGIPKSSLSGRLRGLVDQGLVSLDELAKLVNVSAGD